MNLDERDLWTPTTPANPAAKARKCVRHDWHQDIFRVFCRRCGRERDDTASRRGRNSRKRGGAEELVVARKLGGEKVGPLGLPHDVIVPGYLRLQVKKLARWPSLAAVLTWLDAMPAGAEMRGVTIASTGHGTRRVLVLDLDEFAEHHGEGGN